MTQGRMQGTDPGVFSSDTFLAELREEESLRLGPTARHEGVHPPRDVELRQAEAATYVGSNSTI